MNENATPRKSRKEAIREAVHRPPDPEDIKFGEEINAGLEKLEALAALAQHDEERARRSREKVIETAAELLDPLMPKLSPHVSEEPDDAARKAYMDATATEEREASEVERDAFTKVLKVIAPVVHTSEKNVTSARDSMRDLAMRVATTSITRGFIRRLSGVIGISDNHFRRLFEPQYPDFLAYIGPGTTNKHGYRGARSPAYTGGARKRSGKTT